MIIGCPKCKAIVELAQEYAYHAGFSDRIFLYCDRGDCTLLITIYDKHLDSFIDPSASAWDLTEEQRRGIEDHLIECPNGAKFRFENLPRCPDCGASLQQRLPSRMHFIEIGEVLDGDKMNVWKDRPSRGS